MTKIEMEAYRRGLVEELIGHSAGAIAEDAGGWASDRLNSIRDVEWDLAEMGVDIEPFNLARYQITRTWM